MQGGAKYLNHFQVQEFEHREENIGYKLYHEWLH